ncbi:MAG TPA: NUDIX hydrolase [Candidatus Limnocylindria bacterium]|nr:NUDIX hydrolase [Candidatus Limnocylindria bacterium]
MKNAAVHAGPFSRVPRPLTAAMRGEVAALAGRLGRPIDREIALHDIAFDPVGNPSRFAEVCMVVRRPTGNVLLSIKTFYPRGAYRLPTGGIDQDEPILDAVVRETVEETGLRLEVTRFLAALTYRDGPTGPPVFHTFAFLLDDPSGAPVTPLDEHEQIESYIEVPVSGLPHVAERLERIPPDGAPGIPNWDAWGRFRAHAHRAAHEALTG